MNRTLLTGTYGRRILHNAKRNAVLPADLIFPGEQPLFDRSRNTEREGASLVTVQQLIDVLQSNGWREAKSETDCRCFQHETLRRTVTISGKLDLIVPPAVLRAVKRYAQLQE